MAPRPAGLRGSAGQRRWPLALLAVGLLGLGGALIAAAWPRPEAGLPLASEPGRDLAAAPREAVPATPDLAVPAEPRLEPTSPPATAAGPPAATPAALSSSQSAARPGDLAKVPALLDLTPLVELEDLPVPVTAPPVPELGPPPPRPDLAGAAAAAPSPDASDSGIRVFIHYRSGDAAEAALARRLADHLRRQGVTVADLRAVGFAIEAPSVRYFFAADRAASERLVGALAAFFAAAPSERPAAPSDFTTYAPKPRRGNVELWLRS
jgi:DNA polymerase-3 subunit gamma/tau